VAGAARDELLDGRPEGLLVHALAFDRPRRGGQELGPGRSLRRLDRVLRRQQTGYSEHQKRKIDCRKPVCYGPRRHMPLRQFAIGPIGEEVYPRFVRELAEHFDDPALDRNLVVRDALSVLYLGRPFEESLILDRRVPLGVKTLMATFDPRNATVEAEYYREIDLEKWARVKPLLWFWQMFDHSPVGRNVRLGTQVRAMLAERVFRRCGQGIRIFHEVEFSFGYNISVGDRVTIHRNVLIDDRGEVILGNDVSVSDYANIYSHSHAVEDIHAISLGKTVIGDRSRVTYHATVLSGVTVEPDSIVGSMGLASKSVPAGTIVGGVPARPIGQVKKS
jgi:acetyltransferase-like isoleucine patch superfamily enzyme